MVVRQNRVRQKIRNSLSKLVRVAEGHSYPVTSGLCDVFAHLLGRETEGTDLGGESRRSTDLTTGCPEVAVSGTIVSLLVVLVFFLGRNAFANGHDRERGRKPLELT